MDNINEYITINEFAKRTNISRQAVYKRVDKDLTEYCKVFDNKKMLSIKALELFTSNNCQPVDEKLSTNCQSVEQPVDSGLQNTLNTVNSTIKLLKEQLQNLYKQLESKDHQIEQLSKQIDEKDKQINQLLSLQQNDQVLLAQSNQKQLNSVTETSSDTSVMKKTSWWKRKKDKNN